MGRMRDRLGGVVRKEWLAGQGQSDIVRRLQLGRGAMGTPWVHSC
jgi:hypothetical protein